MLMYPRLIHEDVSGSSEHFKCWDVVPHQPEMCATSYIALVEVLDPLPDDLVEVMPGSRLRAVEGGEPAVAWIRLRGRPRTTIDVAVEPESTHKPPFNFATWFDPFGSLWHSINSSNWNQPQPIVITPYDDQKKLGRCCLNVSLETSAQDNFYSSYALTKGDDYIAWGGEYTLPAGVARERYFRGQYGRAAFKLVDNETRSQRPKRGNARCDFGVGGKDYRGQSFARYPHAKCAEDMPAGAYDAVFRHWEVYGMHEIVSGFVPGRGWIQLGQNKMYPDKVYHWYRYGEVAYSRPLPRNATRIRIHVDATRWAAASDSQYVLNPQLGHPE